MLASLFNMVNSALPGEDERLEKLKLVAPKIAARAQEKAVKAKLRQYRRVLRFMKRHQLTEAQLNAYLALKNEPVRLEKQE